MDYQIKKIIIYNDFKLKNVVYIYQYFFAIIIITKIFLNSNLLKDNYDNPL